MPEATAGRHAVVIGASVAGLLAASALSASFGQVTVYDRDDLPDEPLLRRGVPQSRQGHGLHARGAAATDELLPGFFKELVAAGGIEMDPQLDITWYLDGNRLSRARSGLTGVAMTRRLLERLIRQRVESLRRVPILDKTTVDGLTVQDGRVTCSGRRRLLATRLSSRRGSHQAARSQPAGLGRKRRRARRECPTPVIAAAAQIDEAHRWEELYEQ